ncbi:UDP-glucosyl transferase 73C2 [Actinidia rufa]|uniref:UDP-glucosyl transferase 73C2 n=1 Tax=Actinidia rufa TaxID=165716 RepID=A0A7J0DZ42_9ERIC|nr:UDP-glucosyl transferase 73C2 [Actinidia rufa]
MAAQAHQPHFIVFPLMAQGHMIPMIDIAKLLAQRGVKVTIVTTPLNAEQFKTIIARAKGLYSMELVAFSLLCSLNVKAHNVLDQVNSDSEYFVVPGLPHKIELTKAQLPGFNPSSSSGLKSVSDQIRKAEKEVYGVVVNTFEELEAEYVMGYKKAKGERVWWGEEEKVGVLVKKDTVKEAIDELMDGGIEGEERRTRARQLGEMANRATEEAGSSHLNITMLIQDVMEYANSDQ